MDSVEFAYMVDFLYRVGYLDTLDELDKDEFTENMESINSMLKMIPLKLPSESNEKVEVNSNEDQTDIIREVVEEEEEQEEELSYEDMMNSYNWERRMRNVVQD